MKRGFGGAGLLAAAGAAHALSFAPGPLPAWSLVWVQILMLAVLAHAVLQAPTRRRAWLRGWGFASVSFTVGLYWLYVSMHDYGAMAAPLAAAGVVALSVFLAIFPATAGWLARSICPPHVPASPWRACWVALVWAASWTLFEWLRATVMTGFPWLNIGYGVVDSPIAGWGPVLGVHGMAFVTAFAAAAVASLKATGNARQALAAAVAVVLVLAGWVLSLLPWSRPHGEPLAMRLVQGNVEQSQKFDLALMEQGLRRHLELAAMPPAAGSPSPELIILPETVLPVFQDQLAPQVWEAWKAVAARQSATIAMGVPLRLPDPDGRTRYTNSVLGLDATTPLADLTAGRTSMRYDKQHLVPWGEFVPPGFRWFVDMLEIPLGDFDRGAAYQRPFVVGDQRVAFNICYEDLFGPELLPALYPDASGLGGATIMANVSNLGWFGNTWALRQHMQIGRLRSIETARPMVTATNTGITAAIDARGRVVAELATHKTGILPVTVQGMTGLTPYARFGDKLVLLIVGVVLVAAAARVRRRR
ncbi:apolipoprotein N-acyltransferase [Bordetella holmesii]|uniref:Apolipoprotein N-acyltransferase n=3 Tax=Bordetella holmesii TaxID=35814 RepID=A0A158M593_9BORD|nr:apolipoprotein N-acyltransferase [Bordetella holmesii]AHV94724.1 apolipoprotein N-acyltransferase [Bordetella holmesii ATCC 51541]AIT27635.1 apolipoprotein N-acyltransferase [Bordetella holmesii 44057]EWM40410.1 apolipoprotein N-acyltransferase [Bordetella holmesii 35009]EWM42331.1 apolipoprotein N-acyltransferase [Bordetella holmesii 41130]EWM49213.1 apolipoprotein N-acyltransferase [Bordetella holmesii 70147]